MRDIRATKLIESDVHNSQGENFGSVKDLIIDIANERVYFAVLSSGGFLGMGDKLFAIPLTAFRPVSSDDKVILIIDNARLASTGSPTRTSTGPNTGPRSTATSGRTSWSSRWTTRCCAAPANGLARTCGIATARKSAR
jgi:sporulation protein YlmC with PRC-barrel domain